MSGEVRTQGTQVAFLDTTIKEILNVADIGEFGGQADEIDISNLKSTAKEKLTGMIDNGEIPLQINLNPQDPVHQKLMASAGTGVLFPFWIGLADGTGLPTAVSTVLTPPSASARTSYVFLASIKSFRQSMKMNDAARVTCALLISGAVTPTWKTP